MQLRQLLRSKLILLVIALTLSNELFASGGSLERRISGCYLNGYLWIESSSKCYALLPEVVPVFFVNNMPEDIRTLPGGMKLIVERSQLQGETSHLKAHIMAKTGRSAIYPCFVTLKYPIQMADNGTEIIQRNPRISDDGDILWEEDFDSPSHSRINDPKDFCYLESDSYHNGQCVRKLRTENSCMRFLSDHARPLKIMGISTVSALITAAAINYYNNKKQPKNKLSIAKYSGAAWLLTALVTTSWYYGSDMVNYCSSQVH